MTYSTEDPRILVVHWGRTGGGPLFTLNLVRALASAGTYVGVGFNAEADNAAEYSDALGPLIRVKTYRSRVGVVLRSPLMIWHGLRTARFIRRHRITHVVCAMESIFQSIALPILLPRGVHYSVVVHDARNHPGDEHLLKRLGRRLELNRADALVALSSAVRDELEGSWSRSLLSGYLPADPNLVSSPRGLPMNRPLVVGFFGRLLPYKGIDLFLDAADILQSQGLDLRFEIWGSGPEERLSARRQTNVSWHTGWVEPDEVSAVIARFDVIALPYVEASQSGIISWACRLGIPFVATPVGGLQEQVDRSRGGMLAADITSTAVAESIVKLVGDPIEYERRSRLLLEASTGALSWSHFASSLREFLSSCTSDPEMTIREPGRGQQEAFAEHPDSEDPPVADDIKSAHELKVGRG